MERPHSQKQTSATDDTPLQCNTLTNISLSAPTYKASVGGYAVGGLVATRMLACEIVSMC